ncbi:ubiquitin-domain-containing protein [Coccomyxa subellipsoidea C-169]|uniref:Ubiquitin-domain-containing protein n=1 Tax=Coccomyxa subellipsoidea (strain C-169) TaxID=574566 RepID=I0YTN6_COCSC|nr:ubiquitin-domain-containing protein [Coccomyxa subellipsoidea C-169]EIE21755.1 ubiquitin-domain-containing protein [Coccomyxa subellipsoidea C-169]|eukprot:XP_005646299.1 ubiquitin-domain-containing protein [Coccomyxa subellipsoidea C-169]
MDSIARTCLGALANAARLRNAFVPLLDDLPITDRAASVLELIHYNPQRGTDTSDIQWGCEAHEDRGLLTVIYSPLSRGLEVQSSWGDWQSCVLQSRHVLLIAGHTLEHASSGHYIAAQHRVDGARVTHGRDSIVYKLRARTDAEIDTKAAILAAGLPYRPARYPQPGPRLRFLLYVITLTGTLIRADLNAGAQAATVLDLKERVQDKSGIPVDQQRLLYAGIELEDDRLFSEYDIRHEYKIHLVLRLRGD